jgi:hypothetical protein
MPARFYCVALLLAAGCAGDRGDSVNVDCEEQSRAPYTEAESSIQAPLDEYVSSYASLDGAWAAEVNCVDGSSGSVQVSITAAPTSEMDVATYEGASCDDVSVAVLAETPVAIESEIVSVAGVTLETKIMDAPTWGVAIMSGDSTNGTSVLIEMASDGEIRGSIMASETSGSDQLSLECEFTNWTR